METVKREFTAEVKNKLKGLVGFSVETPFPYTPKAFREALPKEQWPVFVLRSKSGTDIAKAEDGAGYYEQYSKDGTDFNRFVPTSGSRRLETLGRGILKIRRFPLEDGSILEYDRKDSRLFIAGAEVKGDVLDYVPVKLQIDLQNAINERSELTEEEKTGLEY